MLQERPERVRQVEEEIQLPGVAVETSVMELIRDGEDRLGFVDFFG